MRKLLSVLSSTLQGGVRGGLLFLALLATTTLWAYDFQYGELYYNITSSSEPYTVEVTYQEYSSPSNYSGLTSATIPETITYEGTIYSVTSIGDWAFAYCSALTSITIPNSVTSIGEGAFCYCSSLTSVTIGNSVTSIGEGAFCGCSSLTSVTIGNSVTSIGNGAFVDCSSLSSIVVESGNSTYDSRENCNAIIETATNTLIAGCQNTIIPNSVTSIGFWAFGLCSSLTSVTIPNNVTSIGEGAFYGCSSLTSITIPNSVTSIGERAFYGCSSLTSITISNSVTSIGSQAFYECESLTSITIPNSVTSIGSQAFYECESLTSVTIGNSVTSIGSSAFSNCTALTSIVVESGNSTYDSRENCNAIIETATNTLVVGCKNTIIPNSVTSIGEEAFEICDALISITIPNSVTSIGDYAFFGCTSLASVTIGNSVTSIGTAAFEICDALTSITIPNSVTSIGNEAFWGCSSLTSVTIGNSVTSIGRAAFHSCSSLTSITIPNSVTSIGSSAFRSCDALTSVTIPNSVTSIGNLAFEGCNSLKTVICEAIEVPELDYGVFHIMYLSKATLYVPAQSLDDYKAAEQWKEFGTILPIEGESEEEIELQDTEMTIVFTNSEDNDSEIYRQTLTIKVPIAPTIAGFTFLYWQPVAEPITNEITIQAIYEADVPSSAPEVFVNPANPAQKLLRNGQIYILQDGKTYTITGQRL